MIIDTHQHFWKYNPESHGWINEEMKVIRKDFLPQDLLPVYKENGIDGCIAVQADQTEAETRFLLDLAAEHPFIKGVVGWVDFRSERIEERLAFYKTFDALKGFRHIVQAEADPNFLLRNAFMNGVALLEQYDFCYEILVYPHQLGSVLEFVRSFSNIRFVIDHIAKPYIKDGFFDGWAAMMEEISCCPNVYCKVSGLVTEADYNHWNYEQLQPYLTHVLDCFGMERTMYGSDWPVCLVAGTYKDIKAVAEQAVADYSKKEQAAFWYKNAVAFYKM